MNDRIFVIAFLGGMLAVSGLLGWLVQDMDNDWRKMLDEDGE